MCNQPVKAVTSFLQPLAIQLQLPVSLHRQVACSHDSASLDTARQRKGNGMNFRPRLCGGFGTSLIIPGILAAPSILRAHTAKVTGTVLDTSGAAVVGASVTATNAATSVTRSSVSTDTGAFTISSLQPGVYIFTFTKTGFKAVKFEQVALTVDQVLTLDTKREVGAVSSTVEVAAANVTQIDAETATLSNVVEHTQMTELPLILRDPYQLVLLGPGINNWDVALSKNTVMSEKFTFQLRFEFYNLFNRTQFKKPDTNIQDSLFGYSASQVGQNDAVTGAGQVQIGAKLNF
jgi:hypothetical protein